MNCSFCYSFQTSCFLQRSCRLLMSSFNIQLIHLKTSPRSMGLTPEFLFNGISLKVVNASIDFGSTIVDTSVLAETAIFSLSSFVSVFNFYSVAYDGTDQCQDEMDLPYFSKRSCFCYHDFVNFMKITVR